MTLAQIAQKVGALVLADDIGAIKVSNIAPLSEAGPNDLAYCDANKGNLPIKTNAAACLIGAKDAGCLPEETAAIIVKSPRAAFAQIAPLLMTVIQSLEAGASDVRVENGAFIHPTVVIGNGAEIGAGTIIGPNCVIGAGVAIGRDCVLDANCVLQCAYIGDRVKIGAGSVIGKAGFGVVAGPSGPIDVPQFGRVIIQDDVTIGALCTIDRGAFDDTIIGLCTKIDNHCHIAHNVIIGQGVIMAAFAGISGSVEIGDYAMLGGRVGVGDHFKIGRNAKIAAGSAVLSDVPANETYGGYPAKPRLKWLREIVKLAKLSETK